MIFRLSAACGNKAYKVVAKQPVHLVLGGKGLGIAQGTSVWVGSPKSTHKAQTMKGLSH